MSPYPIKYVITPKHDLRISQKQFQKLIFLKGKLHRRAACGHCPYILRHSNVLKIYDIAIFVLNTSEPCFHTADHFHNAERFAHIIISSQVKPFHTVKLGGFCRDDDNGYSRTGRIAAKLTKYRKPVIARQHNVQQYQIGRAYFDRIIKAVRVFK